MSEPPQFARAMPSVYPASPPLEAVVDRFWQCGPEFDAVEIHVEPPDTPLALLRQLGPSPFERGGFPLVGFLATVYDRVTSYATERRKGTS